jgi:hypothetical protein
VHAAKSQVSLTVVVAACGAACTLSAPPRDNAIRAHLLRWLIIESSRLLAASGENIQRERKRERERRGRQRKRGEGREGRRKTGQMKW